RLLSFIVVDSPLIVVASFSSFFFNDTATTDIYTLSLHDALPISGTEAIRYSSRPAKPSPRKACAGCWRTAPIRTRLRSPKRRSRSEEHTSELQSLAYLVCRLLLEKKKINTYNMLITQIINADISS